MTPILLSLLATLVPTHASIDDVRPGNPVCYQREYSDDHMKANALQTVKKMKLRFSQSEYHTPDTLSLDVEAHIKKIKTRTTITGKKVSKVVYRPFSNVMFCQREENQLRCGVECDGGSATIQWDIATKDREILLKNNGFVLHGGCGDELQEGETIWLDPKKGGDDVFRLYAMPKHQCQ